MPDHAALQVLGDHSLFQSIVSFAPGIPFFVLRVKRQLKCTQPEAAVLSYFCDAKEVPPEDIALWQNAVSTGDKRTLEALHVLASLESDVARRQVGVVLRGIFDFVVEQAMETRDTSLLDWIRANGLFPFDRLSQSVRLQLGERGDVQMLRRLHEHGCYINFNAVNGAAANGHLDVLQYIHSLGRKNARIDSGAIQFAAANGHLHVLEFLLQQQTEWVLRQGWTTERDLRYKVMEGYSKAIESGHLHVVQYLHENGFECHDDDMVGAAANGHLDIVKYMHENQVGDNALRAVDVAVMNGHLEVVKFLLSTGRILSDYRTIEDVVKNDHFDKFKVLHDSGVDGAVRYALSVAVKSRNMKFAKFLYELDPKVCADEGGYLTAYAAERGYLEFIEFFHACGDPKFFDDRAVSVAAANGHLDIVKFLHENRDEGCGSYVVELAQMRGYHHVVDYLCENRPMKRAKYHADSARRMGYPDLAVKIERGAAAATATGRKLYRYE